MHNGLKVLATKTLKKNHFGQKTLTKGYKETKTLIKIMKFIPTFVILKVVLACAKTLRGLSKQVCLLYLYGEEQ